MTLDSRHLLACVIALVPSGVRVLDALGVHDTEAGLLFPSIALSGRANRFFLGLAQNGILTREAARSIAGNTCSSTPIGESAGSIRPGFSRGRKRFFRRRADSTKERLNMHDYPSSDNSLSLTLIGLKIGIRFDQAAQGLTSLIGIQVDPLFGSDKDNERLFIRVANLGNESLKLLPGAEVFTFEVHEVTGKVRAPSPGKESTWLRLKEHLANQSDASWTYVTQVDQDLTEQTEHIREYLQPLVLFGVFLVAVTILGVSISVILNLRETSSGQVPNWMTNWGWILLLITLSLATSATAWVGFAAGIRILWPYRLNRSRPRKRQRWKFWKNRGPQNQRSDPLYR